MYINLIFLVILCLFGVSFGIQEFRSDWTNPDESSFKFYNTPLTWDNARTFCQTRDGILASPITTKVRDIMTKLLKTTRKSEIYIGVHSTYKKESYISLDGTPLTSMPQSWTDPDIDTPTDTEKCITLNTNGQMSYVACDKMRSFICYEKLTFIKSVKLCGNKKSDKYYYIDGRTDKCYKFHDEPKNYKEASLICYEEGGHLAIINGEEEAQVVRDIFARNPTESIPGDFEKNHAAIGFYYWGENSKWMTLHGHTIQEAGYDKFDIGEPNNLNEDEYCGSVSRNGLLNDSPCTYRFMFICEKDPVTNLVASL